MVKRILNKNISDSFWYTFGEIINKTSVFLLIPFYTTYFSKEEYGILSLVIIFTTISNHIISYGSKTALLRLIYDYSKDQNKKLIFTVISNLFFILISVLLCLIVFHFISYKNDLVFLNYFKYCYFICFHSFFFSLINIGLTLIRVDRKVKYFTAFNLLKTVTEIVLIFFFVKFLSDGVFGKIIGSLASVMILSLVIYFVSINKNISFSYSRKMSKDYFYFATPLVINNLVGWTLVSYDQFLFQHNFGLEQLAILALVFQICSIYKFSMEGVLRAFNVYLYEKMKVVKKGAKEIFVFFISLFSICGFLLIIFKEQIILIISTSDYIEAKPFITYFVFSRFIMLINLLIVFFLLIDKNSKEVTKATFISLITMLLFSTYLIPNYGFVGASIAAVLTFLSRNIYLLLILKKSINFYSLNGLLGIISFVLILLINIFFKVNMQLNLAILVFHILLSAYLNKNILKRIFL